jgi:ribosomal protein S18 acetylase RimI-like enzyme
MRVASLTQLSIPEIADVMAEGRPWLPETSDYWFFRTFCGSTSFAAFRNGLAVGAVIACVNQENSSEIYVDQVAVRRSFRGRGVVEALMSAVERRARELGCSRLWLSTDPANPAMEVWPRLGYRELGIERDFKGPGKDRAIFEKLL